MIRFGARIAGIDRMRRRAQQAGPELVARLTVALNESAALVQAEAQRLIADPPKTGRIYKKYNPRRTHQASAPGQAPATDLGTLINSIVIDRADLPRGRIVIAATAEHARHLEYGTRKMAPRPFLRRALRNSQGRILALFRAAL